MTAADRFGGEFDDAEAIASSYEADEQDAAVRNGHAPQATSQLGADERLQLELLRSAFELATLRGDVAALAKVGADLQAFSERVEGEHAPDFVLDDLADVFYEELPPQLWLVEDGLLGRGMITQLVAPPKVGKSISGTEVCVEIAAQASSFDLGEQGGKWLGSRVVGGGGVIFLSGEGGPHLLQSRLRRMVAPSIAEHVLRHRAFSISRRPFPDIARRSHLDAVLRQAERQGVRDPALLIVDPLVRFWRSVMDEQSNREATRFYEELRAFAEVHQLAVLITHHESHGRTKDVSRESGGRGPSALGAEPDMIINLRRSDRGDGHIDAVFAGRWTEPPDCILRRDPSTLRVLAVAAKGGRSADEGGRSFSLQSLIEALSGKADGVTQGDLVVALGTTKDTFRKWWKKYREQDTRLQRTTRGSRLIYSLRREGDEDEDE